MESVICSQCAGEYPSAECKTVNGQHICIVCQENLIASATSIKFYEPSGIHEFMYAPHLLFFRKDTQESVDNIPGIAMIQDGVPMLRSGFTHAINHWKFAFGDERHKKFSAFMKALTNRTIVPPCPVIVTLVQDGNLSMVVYVSVRTTDAEKFMSWVGRSDLSMKLN
jgi:hypothetical protein